MYANMSVPVNKSPFVKGGSRGNVNIYSREKDSQNDCPFSVNPPGLQHFSIMHKLSKSCDCFVIYTHTTLTFVRIHIRMIMFSVINSQFFYIFDEV